MSENIPETSSSAPFVHRRSKRKAHEKIKLPTPPPDPHEIPKEPADKEKEFLEYLDNLHKTINPLYARSNSTFAPVIATEEAFDHLDKLYKLMEQMLELREQNAKLHRRIRDLEHLNNIEKMHRQLEISGVERDCPELDKDTAFAETILESILLDTKKDIKPKSAIPMKLRPSILRRQRNRSGSTVDKNVTLDEDTVIKEQNSYEGRLDKPSKVSKWTKVKAAFKWEKASNVGDNKSQDSGFGVEIARYLRVPSTSDDTGHSPADSGAAGISTPGSLSTASSNEDFHRTDCRSPYEQCRSSEDEHNYIPNKDDSSSKHNQKYARTPWAKMKDMIQTRNSFKKKQRLSAQSDDIQIDVELCSDNEDVFEEEGKTCLTVPSSAYARLNSSEIPSEIVARYQQAIEDDNFRLNYSESRKVSKWTRVKKAFLTPQNSPYNNSYTTKEKQNETESHNVEEEIERSYKQLQKKLSLEFQEKLNEWDRIKQSSPGTSNPSSTCGFLEESQDPTFIKKLEEWQKIKTQQQPSNKVRPTIQMTREFDLPPEFKKKLQEWEKIKKSSGKESSSSKKKIGDFPRWKSLSGHRSETSSVEYPVISDDFRKKLEEWKQIKANNATGEYVQKKFKEKTPSPKLSRRNSSGKPVKKQKEHEKELHWFEKELTKIEKEKQRLERERQKFLEREERLSKLRRSVTGGNKKEVLIHTPSGFYRFEGISRKFTQKLYEWEKAQGIGPEASTFALLSSPYIPDIPSGVKRTRLSNSPPLTRSKSADSVTLSGMNLQCPLLSQQPSSLSLNNVDDLEKECLADSKSSSIQYMIQSHEVSDNDEPEALIVEVEDYEEETAAPLQTYFKRGQRPIYHREEKTMCDSEMVAAPKVRRSESVRAQTNYNLIEEIGNIMKSLSDNEFQILNLYNFIIEEDKSQYNEGRLKLKVYFDQQKQLSKKLIKKLHQLQEENASVVSSINKDSISYTASNVFELFDGIQDLTSDILQKVDKMDQDIERRSSEEATTSNISFNCILESLNSVRNKMLELRRNLSYVCAASDLTAPSRKTSFEKKKPAHKTISSESKDSRCDSSDTSRQDSLNKAKEENRYVKAEQKINQSQGAVKKKIKYRQKSLQSRSLVDTDDEEDRTSAEQRKNKHKKLTRTRSISESNIQKCYETTNDDCSSDVDINIVQKFIVPTETNFVNSKPISEIPDTPVTIFVKTTRKLFTPIGETNICLEPKPATNTLKQTNTVDSKESELSSVDENPNIKVISTSSSISHLPPLPNSPVPQRKIFKDVSPSIKIMLAKYNQKLYEQDSANGKSGGSSGSASPIAWRSPTAERRVKAQTERYQEVLNKLSPLLGGRREVQKSASVSYLHTGNKQVTVPYRKNSTFSEAENNHNILKSSSVSAITTEKPLKSKELEQATALPKPKPNLEIDISLTTHEPSRYSHSPEIRQKKLQKAKEDFFKYTPTSTASTPSKSDCISFPTRNRLSQISVGSESSYDSAYPGSLIKSASAGMINIDADTYRQFDPEIHGGGYVSLPRFTKKPKDGIFGGKFAISNITSKFRKVKMRRGKDNKDPGKMNAVSTLCRQSLVVDINPPKIEEQSLESVNDRSENGSPSSSKSGTWLRRPKLFKK